MEAPLQREVASSHEAWEAPVAEVVTSSLVVQVAIEVRSEVVAAVVGLSQEDVEASSQEEEEDLNPEAEVVALKAVDVEGVALRAEAVGVVDLKEGAVEVALRAEEEVDLKAVGEVVLIEEAEEDPHLQVTGMEELLRNAWEVHQFLMTPPPSEAAMRDPKEVTVMVLLQANFPQISMAIEDLKDQRMVILGLLMEVRRQANPTTRIKHTTLVDLGEDIRLSHTDRLTQQ